MHKLALLTPDIRNLLRSAHSKGFSALARCTMASNLLIKGLAPRWATKSITNLGHL